MLVQISYKAINPYYNIEPVRTNAGEDNKIGNGLKAAKCFPLLSLTFICYDFSNLIVVPFELLVSVRSPDLI
jgi:hypothetical protein